MGLSPASKAFSEWVQSGTTCSRGFSQERATLLSSQKANVDSESALNPSIPKESLYGSGMNEGGLPDVAKMRE
jgi:hypothetical protein